VSRFWLAAIFSAALALAQQTNLATIEGHVHDGSGRPVRKAGMTLRAAQGASVFSVATDADGKFSFARIAPGGYTLSAERTGYQRKLYRASLHETFSTLTVAAGQNLKNVDLVLQRAFSITGRVLDADGDPVAVVSVSLLRHTLQSGSAMEATHSVYTDEAGKYTMPDLAPGSYYLRAGPGDGRAFSIVGMRAVTDPSFAAQDYYADTFYPGAVDQAGAKAIAISADDVPGADIHLRKTPAFLVKGKLVGTLPGDPGAQCQVILTRADLPATISPWPRGVVDHPAKDGTFHFAGSHFPPGEYFLTAELQMRRLVVAPQRLTIANRDIDDAVLNLQPFVQLHGSVTMEGRARTDFSKYPGTPPPSVTMGISLLPTNSPMLLSGGVARIDAADGSFTIADVAPGSYTVRLSGIPGLAWPKSIRLGSQDARNGEIAVRETSGSTPLRITLSPAQAQISGVVKSVRGKPVAGSTIILIGEPGTRTALTGSDQNGDFTFSTLEPGAYRLFAWEDIEAAQRYDPDSMKAHESQSVRVVLKENEKQHVTLREIPAGEHR
jgi:protocatechuate 3,4-dioxygenase beta subunit